MHEEDYGRLDLPKSCPVTISRISLPESGRRETWLIREHDPYGEYPHIYAKICHNTSSDSQQSSSGAQSSSSSSSRSRFRGRRQVPVNHTQDAAATSSSADTVIVLSDVGCGTEVPNTTRRTNSFSVGSDKAARSRHEPEPEVWNLRTFLEYTINPDGRIPYLVLSTHCHYDHVLGLAKLPPCTAGAGGDSQDLAATRAAQHEHQHQHPNGEGTNRPATTVLASSHDKSFVTPYANLQKHSLCKSVGLDAPRYTITWVEDMSYVTWNPYVSSNLNEPDEAKGSESSSVNTQITVLYTPGHTPDSLSWYDADLALLCVGDTFYLKETDVTRTSPWGPEPPMPTNFPLEGNMVDLWKTLRKLLDFARARDKELQLEADRQADATACTAVRDDGAQQSYSTSLLSSQSSDSHLAGHHNHGLQCRSPQNGFSHTVPNRQGHLPEPVFQTVICPASSVEEEEGDARHRTSGVEEEEQDEEEDWLLVDLPPTSCTPPPYGKVRLAAAHTTVSLDDAEAAILSFWEFMARVLRDQIPKIRIEDGSRGEERWLWDYALQQQNGHSQSQRQSQPYRLPDSKTPCLRYLRKFSVVAPLSVIEEGRRNISALDISCPVLID